MKLMEMAVLAALIGDIGKQRVAFDASVQQACVQVIGQSIVHRNITPANALLDVVGAHLKPVLVAHLEKFGNMAWVKAEKKFAFHETTLAPGHDALRFGQAVGDKLIFSPQYAEHVAATLWHKAKKEPEPTSVYDVAEEADKFLERLMKAAKKGAELKHKALLTKLSEVYNRYQAETYLASITVEPTEADKAEATKVDAGAAAARLAEHFGKATVKAV